MTEILNCGHESDPTGLTAGYARDDTGALCYKCAAEKIKANALRDNYLFAYISADKKSIVTWDGQILGTVSDTHKTSGHRTFYRAKLWDGRHWYGWGPAEYGAYVSLRPYKSQ